MIGIPFGILKGALDFAISRLKEGCRKFAAKSAN